MGKIPLKDTVSDLDKKRVLDVLSAIELERQADLIMQKQIKKTQKRGRTGGN